MSFNSSTSSDSSFFDICFKSKTNSFIVSSFVMTNILLLFPLFFLILYLGLQQRRKQRSGSTTETMSHSDFFTYNMIGLELINILGSSLYCFGVYAEGLTVQLAGVFICSVASPGQTLFHLLTCVERYLAVVHPITYLGLKQAGGVKIRNVSAGCIFLLCVGLAGVSYSSSTCGPITNACLLIFSLVFLFFCSFFILRALNHPGPRKVSVDRERVDQSKQRAFHTILAITIALLFRLFGCLVNNIMFTSPELTHTKCVVGSSSVWLTLPSSLVLPLLFLQRAGKLPVCKSNRETTN